MDIFLNCLLVPLPKDGLHVYSAQSCGGINCTERCDDCCFSAIWCQGSNVSSAVDFVYCLLCTQHVQLRDESVLANLDVFAPNSMGWHLQCQLGMGNTSEELLPVSRMLPDDRLLGTLLLAVAGNLTVDQRSALSQDYRDQPSVTQGLRAWGSDAEKQQQHPVCDFEGPADACIVLAAIGNSVIFDVSVPAPGMGYFWNNVQTTDDSEMKR